MTKNRHDTGNNSKEKQVNTNEKAKYHGDESFGRILSRRKSIVSLKQLKKSNQEKGICKLAWFGGADQ